MISKENKERLHVLSVLMILLTLLLFYYFNLLNNFTNQNVYLKFLPGALIVALSYFLVNLYSSLKKENSKIISEKEILIEQNKTENSKLQKDLYDTKQFADDIEKAYHKLELTNQKLNKNAAEYYTLQQISQAIVTILDIEELLGFINDVIIGVMGVNHSSILLVDKNTNTMEVEVTNISDEEKLNHFKSNINSTILSEVAQTGKPLLKNNIDEEQFIFTQQRNVKSLICVPLSRKNEKFGLILVEQERADAFEDEHLKFLLAISNQMSVALENVGLYEKMQRMATVDALTNIYNRLYFNEMLSKEMAKADNDNYPMSIAIFDIDHFKKFNDTYGHLFGDLVLKTIAKLAKDHARLGDIVSRFGGEEFVIIMPNTSIEVAYEFIEELRIKISKCNVKDGSVVAGVTASFGISCYPQHGSNEAGVLSVADSALYKAKNEGRNCTRIYSSEQ